MAVSISLSCLFTLIDSFRNDCASCSYFPVIAVQLIYRWLPIPNIPMVYISLPLSYFKTSILISPWVSLYFQVTYRQRPARRPCPLVPISFGIWSRVVNYFCTNPYSPSAMMSIASRLHRLNEKRTCVRGLDHTASVLTFTLLRSARSSEQAKQ